MTLEWKRWKVEDRGAAPVAVVEAPGPGLAIEMYCVGHGLLAFGPGLTIEETQDEVTEGYGREENIALLAGVGAVVDETLVGDMDEHYRLMGALPEAGP